VIGRSAGFHVKIWLARRVNTLHFGYRPGEGWLHDRMNDEPPGCRARADY